MSALRVLFAVLALVSASMAYANPDADLRRALQLLLDGDSGGAEEALRPLVAMDPPFTLAHLLLADIYRARAGDALFVADPAMGEPPLTHLAAELRARVSPAEMSQSQLNSIIELPAATTDLLFVNTAAARSYWLRHDESGLQVNRSFYTSIGKAGAGKRKAWDRRTPVGIYFVVDRLEDYELHEQYGPLAFPMDYPNGWDRYHERTGDGIWLHGVERTAYARPPLDSDGCVVLTNDDLRLLAPAVQPRQFAIVISTGDDSSEMTPTPRAALLEFADRWRALAEAGDKSWLDLYAADFKPLAGNADDWRAQQVAVLKDSAQRITIDELFIAAYPGESNLYLLRFAVMRVVAGIERRYYQQLYIRESADAEGFEIVAEGFG